MSNIFKATILNQFKVRKKLLKEDHYDVQSKLNKANADKNVLHDQEEPDLVKLWMVEAEIADLKDWLKQIVTRRAIVGEVIDRTKKDSHGHIDSIITQGNSAPLYSTIDFVLEVQREEMNPIYGSDEGE